MTKAVPLLYYGKHNVKFSPISRLSTVYHVDLIIVNWEFRIVDFVVCVTHQQDIPMYGHHSILMSSFIYVYNGRQFQQLCSKKSICSSEVLVEQAGLQGKLFSRDFPWEMKSCHQEICFAEKEEAFNLFLQWGNEKNFNLDLCRASKSEGRVESYVRKNFYTEGPIKLRMSDLRQDLTTLSREK